MENKKKLLFFGGVRTMCLGLSCNFLVLCYAFFFGNKILFFTHASVCIGRKMGVFVGRYIMNWFSISVWLSQPAGTNQLSKDNEYINLKWNRLATTYSHTNNTHWHTLYDRSEAYKLSVFFFFSSFFVVRLHIFDTQRHKQRYTTHKHNRIDCLALAFSSIIATNRLVSICERRIAM